MLIIVEGPDGSGKSTMVRALTRYLTHYYKGDDLVTYHKRPPAGHPLAEYVEPLLGYRPGQRHHVIADRWHWGEAVYPGVLKRATLMDGAVWRYTEMFLRSRGAVVAFPAVPVAELQYRLARRGDDLVSSPMLPAIELAYRRAVAASLLPTIYRDQDQVHASDVVALAEVHERGAAALNGLHTYVGPARPDFLLVGDERPPTMSRDCPAFMPYPANSGHFLLSSLGRRPRTVNMGLINANDVDDVEIAWKTLGEPRVVTLGRLAHRRCRHVPHSQVPHPQFVRRFYQRHGDEYGTAVDAAMALVKDMSGWRPVDPSWSPR